MGDDDLNREDLRDLPLLRAQNPQAFARLVSRYERKIYSLGASLNLTSADLDDGAAEAFAEVFSSLPRFESRSQLSTWIYRIAYRSLLKSRSRLKSHAINIDAVDPPASHEIESAFEKREMSDRIWQTVRSLEPRHAAAVELFYRQDLPIETIATILQCPAGTVKTLLYRARQLLRPQLLQQELVP